MVKRASSELSKAPNGASKFVASYKKAKKKMMSEEQAAIVSQYRNSNKSTVNLTNQFRSAGNFETVALKGVLRNISQFNKDKPLDLNEAKLIFMPIVTDDVNVPEEFKTMKVDRDENGTMMLVFIVKPDERTRTNYNVNWAKWRDPIKFFKVLQLASNNQAFDSFTILSLDDAFKAKQWAEAAHAATAAIQALAQSLEKRFEETKKTLDAADMAVSTIDKTENKEAFEKAKATFDSAASAHEAVKILKDLASLDYAQLRDKVAPKGAEYGTWEYVQAHPEEELDEQQLECSKKLRQVDYDYGVDRLREEYVVKMINGKAAYNIKCPKEKFNGVECENRKGLLSATFGDIIEFRGFRLSAYVWDTTRKDANKVEVVNSYWPKNASINSYAERVKVDHISPITFKIALEALHQAAPGALAHPVVSTYLQDVHSLKKAGKLQSASNDDSAALQQMASILRLTSEPEEERLATQKAGTITKLEEFIETKEESMLSSTNKAQQKFMALKCIADMTTWWPLAAGQQCASVEDNEKSFMYRSTLMIRSFQEHLYRWVPMRNRENWEKLAPFLLANLNAYIIFQRDLKSAAGYELTRSNEDAFRAPWTTNAKRLAEVQILEKGWMKRWAIDTVELLRDNGVPLSVEGVKWLLKTFRGDIPLPETGEIALKTSATVFALNELPEADRNAVLSAPPGTYHFYAVTSGFRMNEDYTEVFDELHENGAVKAGENLAAAVFHNSKRNGECPVKPHALVADSSLPTIPMGKTTYIFVVNALKYEHESQDEVRVALCKMLGYDEEDEANTIEGICADVARQAEQDDEALLPKLKSIQAAAVQSAMDEDLDDAAFLAAAGEAESAAPPLPPPTEAGFGGSSSSESQMDESK